MEKCKKLHPAMLWRPTENGGVKCELCTFGCAIADGEFGRCNWRKNIGGKLFSLNYDRVCGVGVDPIEKKPLFHFLPGSLSMSVACLGCNLRCDFCQNWQISQANYEEHNINVQKVDPSEVVNLARRNGCESISYTYTEPTVFFEFAYDVSLLASEAGLKNIFVSNGHMTIKALETISPYLDGINVDLKSFRDDFYRVRCAGSLKAVLTSLRWLARSDIWLEVTTLVVPGQNDSEAELSDIAKFIAGELGEDTPWHVSRFHPSYQMLDNIATPMETIEMALQIGADAGLRYCYGGNVGGHASENTYCPQCGRTLVRREGLEVRSNAIADGKCDECGADIVGVW